MKIPNPAIERLIEIYRILYRYKSEGRTAISSYELGGITGAHAHNIRKDISFLGEIKSSRNGYNIESLSHCIAERFNIEDEKPICIVGLGKVGQAVLEYERFKRGAFKVVAGFDSDINLIDTIKTDIAVFPSYEIEEVVSRLRIVMAVLTVPEGVAQKCADRLIKGGVRGILNFSPAHLSYDDKNIAVKNMDVLGEFYQLSAIINEM